jgi:glycosyltransferase involved in cell wall biosynthesis
MRIAINAWFLDQPGTGSGHYLRSLLRAMPEVAPDHHFLLVTPGEAVDFQVPELKMEFWPLRSRFWRGGARALGKVWFEQVDFPLICRHWGADVAHVPYWGSPLWPTVPTVVTVHDLIPLVLPAYRGGFLVRLYTRLVALSARRATLVLTDSLASKHDIEAHLSLPAERVRSIYLAADKEFDSVPGPEDTSIRQRYGLPDRYVLYLAGHDVRKNVARLLEAFAIVAKADDDVTLVIGGKLPERNSAPWFDPRPLVQKLGIEGVVRFIGWVQEGHQPALYRGAACAVFPSQYEGFGLPVLEALACGTPLVTSNVSSLPELLGDAGFTLDPDDAHGLAGAILSCLVDDPLAAELRRRGPIQAANFNWAQTAQQTLAAYQEVLACES